MWYFCPYLPLIVRVSLVIQRGSRHGNPYAKRQLDPFRAIDLWLWIRSAISPQHIHATNQSTTSGVVRGGQWWMPPRQICIIVVFMLFVVFEKKIQEIQENSP